MDLNDDVVTEILVNLPVKSLLRFKCVCKSWCSIIGSWAFRKFHLQNQPRNNNNDDDDIFYLQFSIEKNDRWELSSTLSLNNWKFGKDFPAPFHEFLNAKFWDRLIIDGPINGLICMYSEYPHKDDSLSIAICNPCLGEIKILPTSPVWSSLVGTRTRDPPFIRLVVGFGFDSVAEDYKVVQILRSLGGRAYVEVYSGRTNTWRALITEIFEIVVYIHIRINTSYKRSGAAAYWRCRNDAEEVILSFDMHNEVFGIIRLPEFAREGAGTDLFEKDDDSLVLFAYSADYCQLEVWELGRERVWTHVRDVNVLQFEGLARIWPIAFWKYGLVLRSCSKMKELIIFYDYSIEKERKRVELPVRLYFGEMFLEYKSTLNSLDICLN